MPTNIEIKARAPEFALLQGRVASLSRQAPEVLAQEDLFFAAPSGRLKLRILGSDRGELILYHRSDFAGPKTSHYTIAPTSEPAALGAILEQVLPLLAVVKKRRAVYLLGQTRVHLDQVDSLGEFVELEVVLRSDQAEAEGVAIARALMEQLAIEDSQLVEQAYVDMVLALQPRTGSVHAGHSMDGRKEAILKMRELSSRNRLDGLRIENLIAEGRK